MGKFNAKELYEYISRNCLYCARHKACQKLARLREKAKSGGAEKPTGRCREFRERET